jgi:hypothetical protein
MCILIVNLESRELSRIIIGINSDFISEKEKYLLFLFSLFFSLDILKITTIVRCDFKESDTSEKRAKNEERIKKENKLFEKCDLFHMKKMESKEIKKLFKHVLNIEKLKEQRLFPNNFILKIESFSEKKIKAIFEKMKILEIGILEIKKKESELIRRAIKINKNDQNGSIKFFNSEISKIKNLFNKSNNDIKKLKQERFSIINYLAETKKRRWLLFAENVVGIRILEFEQDEKFYLEMFYRVNKIIGLNLRIKNISNDALKEQIELSDMLTKKEK